MTAAVHTGPVDTLVARGPWFDVLDPRVTLHPGQARIAGSLAGVSRARTATRSRPAPPPVLSVVQLFGTRAPGMPERTVWPV